MAKTKLRSKRKNTGGRYKAARKKKQRDLARLPAHTKLGEKRTTKIRGRSALKKVVAFSIDVANVYDSKTKKYHKIKIKTILENPANRHFVRRNIMTKGTIIDTELGKAKIVSRPGQEGVVNAVLI